ncbi:hypothetical protein K491DRAFT_680817 [Lophiostoma macrostomum CBS 122681]|uniref:C2H2-type domain-containing protein n=1 Tax=Lophiostoma macrostomum CBS 122681 TaxID=1314788 RepID=A0A6A6T1X0_9PLEO|nr:hypothetical protein K491DRAFT_680817 [Lophiostoma macrostomum CBS 122681]
MERQSHSLSFDHEDLDTPDPAGFYGSAFEPPNHQQYGATPQVLPDAQNLMSSPGYAARRILPCPVHEGNRLAGRVQTCTGAEELYISGIVKHINGGHEQFCKQCLACKEVVLDEQDYNTNHGNRCQRAFVKRRAYETTIKQWNTLYESLNPLGTPPSSRFAEEARNSQPLTHYRIDEVSRLERSLPGSPNPTVGSSYASPYELVANAYPETAVVRPQFPWNQAQSYFRPEVVYERNVTTPDPFMANVESHAPTPILERSEATVTNAQSAQLGTPFTIPDSTGSNLRHVVQCLHCKTILTGDHASGNLTRHKKSKKCALSSQTRIFPCDEPGCDKAYYRSDALLNHKRRCHGAQGLMRGANDVDKLN